MNATHAHEYDIVLCILRPGCEFCNPEEVENKNI